MAVEQHDKDYGERTSTHFIVLMIALMGVGVFIFPNIEDGPKISFTGYVLIGIWLTVLVVGVILGTKLERDYRCPKCGTYLPRLPAEAVTKYQHRFQCKSCDIIWTTDIREGD